MLEGRRSHVVQEAYIVPDDVVCAAVARFSAGTRSLMHAAASTAVAAAGITEAFVHAVLEPSALKAANALLVVFTAAHVLCSVVLVKAGGAAGLVLADTINMSLRIAFSLW
jgi:hypothetical protein